MTDEKDSRSLDLCAVGLGQGGGNLAAEWRRRGYRSLLVNTAHADLKALSHHDGLDVPDDCVLHIGLEGSEGAGKDPEYGMACVRAHGDEVRQAVERQLDGADGILLCAGLGGGTGSALPELMRVLAPLEVPLITVTTLPSGAESGIAKVNAVKATNSLISAELAGRVFIDNDRLVSTFADVDLVSWYPSVNARVLAPLDELNRLNRRDDLWSIRSFDGEDLRKVLLSGGVLQTHVTRLQEGEEGRALDSAYLVDVVTQCVSGGNHLAQGLELPQVAYLGLVVVGPQKALQGTPMHVFDDAIRQLKERTGGGAVYEGLYVAADDAPLRAYVLSASLALPTRITTLLGDARSEGAELAKKIRADLPTLEVSPLEGLALFRSPTRRPAGERPQAPSPRALAEPMGEVEDMVRPRTRRLDVENEEAEVQSDAYRPRVGTGRYDEKEESGLEPTQVKASDSISGKGASSPHVGTGRRDADPRQESPEPTLFVAGDELQQRETRPYDAPSLPAQVMARAAGAWGESPASPLVEAESSAPRASAQVEAAPASKESGAPPSSAGASDPITVARPPPRLQTSNRAALLSPPPEQEAAPQEFDLADEAAAFEGSLTNPDGEALDVSAELRRIVDESDEDPGTHTDARPEAFLETGAMLRSVFDASGTELQSVYEDLVERFRQAADRRDKERVMRRLIDDASADDVEVRVLAVWAMVKLEDGGFRRALAKCKTDGNPEISRLAEAGLEKIEAEGA